MVAESIGQVFMMGTLDILKGRREYSMRHSATLASCDSFETAMA